MPSRDEKNAMLQGEIDNLNQKVAFLEQKLKELQENRSIPKSPWDVVEPQIPDHEFPKFEIKPECSKCGLKLEKVMGYCCPQSQCPCGLGSTVC